MHDLYGVLGVNVRGLFNVIQHRLRFFYSSAFGFYFGMLALVLVYLTLAMLYILYTPAWQNPDEPAHYNYTRHLVETGSIPVLESNDYNQEYLVDIVSRRFPPELSTDSLRYEGHQPPLYYLLQVPIYRSANGSLLAMRVTSAIIGALIVIVSGLAAWEYYNPQVPMALATAGVVAFIPQHVAMLASVNNDSLAELWMMVGFWLLLRMPLQPSVNAYRLLGVVLGLAFLTKATAYILVFPLLMAIGFDWRAGRIKLSALGVVLLPALLLGGVWWVRNCLVYGWPDVMGLLRHNAVVVGQPRTSDWLREYGVLEVVTRMWNTTFNSFWGQFGWMSVPMSRRVYRLLSVGCAAIFVGLLFNKSGPARGLRLRHNQVLASGAVGTLLAYFYYNFSFVQHQGRYLFPALLPLAVCATRGLEGLVSKLFTSRVLAPKYSSWLPLILVMTLIGLCVWALIVCVIRGLGGA